MVNSASAEEIRSMKLWAREQAAGPAPPRPSLHTPPLTFTGRRAQARGQHVRCRPAEDGRPDGGGGARRGGARRRTLRRGAGGASATGLAGGAWSHAR